MKKLKYQYQQSVKTSHSNEFFLNRFPNMRSVYYKKFSTKQEKSFIQYILLNIKITPLSFV